MLEGFLVGLPLGLTALVFALALTTDPDHVDVRSFTTSEIAAARGYSAERLAIQLGNDIENVVEIASTHHQEKSIEVGVADEPVEHLVDYLDLSPFVKAVQELSGNLRYKMDIALVDDEKGGAAIDMHVHSTEYNRIAYSELILGNENDIDSLIESAAEIIVRVSEPYVYASYLHNKYVNGEGEEYLDEMIQLSKVVMPTVSDEEKKWHLNLLGIAASEYGQYDVAVGLFNEALRLDPRFALAEINMGRALDKLGFHEEAIDYYSSALADEEPSEISIGYVYWAETLAELGAYEDALMQLQVAEWLTPDLALIYEARADILKQQGHVAAAERARRNAGYARLRQPRQSYYQPV